MFLAVVPFGMGFYHSTSSHHMARSAYFMLLPQNHRIPHAALALVSLCLCVMFLFAYAFLLTFTMLGRAFSIVSVSIFFSLLLARASIHMHVLWEAAVWKATWSFRGRKKRRAIHIEFWSRRVMHLSRGIAVANLDQLFFVLCACSTSGQASKRCAVFSSQCVLCLSRAPRSRRVLGCDKLLYVRAVMMTFKF